MNFLSNAAYRLYTSSFGYYVVHPVVKYFSSNNMSNPYYLLSQFRTDNSNPCISIYAIPMLSDNYCYAVVNEISKEISLIDVSEEEKVISLMNDKQFKEYKIKHIFTTHKHHDHSGGNLKMLDYNSEIQIFGSEIDNIPGLTKAVQDGDTITVYNQEQCPLKVKAFFVPCHTIGHMAYLFYLDHEKSEQAALFSGDFLFVGGCGKFFEGTAEDMLSSLDHITKQVQVFEKETNQTVRMYCGHEYTMSNLEFIKQSNLFVNDPKAQEELMKKYEWSKEQRSKQLPTVPSLFTEEELRYNPFLCVRQLRKSNPDLFESNSITDAAALQTIRTMKNEFKPK